MIRGAFFAVAVAVLSLFGLSGRCVDVGDSPSGFRLKWTSEGHGSHVDGQVLEGPSITSLSFSRDGKCLASSARDDREIRVWDPIKGRLRAKLLEEKSRMIWELRFSPADANRLAAAVRDRDGHFDVQIWDVRAASVVDRLAHRGFCIAWSANGSYLVSGGDSARIWSMGSKPKLKHSLASEHGVSAVAFVAQTNTVVTASGLEDSSGAWYRGEVKLWSLDTGKERTSFTGHDGPISRLAASSDGKFLGTSKSSADRSVIVWNLLDGTKAVTIRPKGFSPFDMAFAPDGKSLAIAGENSKGSGEHESGSILIWNVIEKKEITILPGKRGFTRIAWSPDGTMLVAGDFRGNLHAWSVEAK